ncbi:hypothetical protein ECG_06937 [Echinococcus granulosus]|nr:hypothetical protein ECG_06937 [Echinococcus granulosus]
MRPFAVTEKHVTPTAFSKPNHGHESLVSTRSTFRYIDTSKLSTALNGEHRHLRGLYRLKTSRDYKVNVDDSRRSYGTRPIQFKRATTQFGASSMPPKRSHLKRAVVGITHLALFYQDPSADSENADYTFKKPCPRRTQRWDTQLAGLQALAAVTSR